MWRICGALAVALLVAGLAIAPAFSAQPGGRQPEQQKISLLYSVSAASGSLAGKKGGMTLRLKGVAHDTVWFSDRPRRSSGVFESSDLPGSWKGLGFQADPPNAALVYMDPATGFERTVILELSKPGYQARSHSLSFHARVIAPAKAGGNLKVHAASADRQPAQRFGDAGLFIDDGEGEVAGQCLMQPHQNCSELELHGLSFEFQQLQGIVLNGANDYGMSWRGSNLEGLSAVGADLSNSDFSYANLQGANLSEANLSATTMVATELKGANLTGATLAYAEEVPSLAGTTLCRTTMPDQSVDNSDC